MQIIVFSYFYIFLALCSGLVLSPICQSYRYEICKHLKTLIIASVSKKVFLLVCILRGFKEYNYTFVLIIYLSIAFQDDACNLNGVYYGHIQCSA